MDNAGGEKTSKKIVAAVKKVVEIKGSLYLCLPRKIVDHCRVEVGDQVGIVADRRVLTVVLPGSG